jgi:hypothetical protein
MIKIICLMKTLFIRSNGGMHIGHWWESRKEGNHWEDQDVGGWTILKWILES